MKRITIFVAVMILAIACSGSLLAKKNETTSIGMVRIGVVDLGRALNEVNEGKKAKANLEKEFKAKKAELEKKKGKIASLREELEKKGHLLSQEALKEKRDEYQREFLQYQQKAKEYTEQLAKEEGETTSKIIGKLRKVVEDIAKEEGYTFVLEKSQGGVVYGPNNADITDEVIKKYNR